MTVRDGLGEGPEDRCIRPTVRPADAVPIARSLPTWHGGRHRQQLLHALPPPPAVGHVRQHLAHEALAIARRQQQGDEAKQARRQAIAELGAAGPRGPVTHHVSATIGLPIWTTFATLLTHCVQALFRNAATRLQGRTSAITPAGTATSAVR